MENGIWDGHIRGAKLISLTIESYTVYEEHSH